MEPKFDQLLTAKIKRLGRFPSKPEELSLHKSHSVDDSAIDVSLGSGSLSESHIDEAVRVGDKVFYVNEFGKVYTGEIFRGLIILTNKSLTDTITNVEFSVYAT